MAKLLKLQLSGIRSFGPYDDDTQQLNFLSPLTLLLGQNGCGKTTIIEAIRYALTGEVPSGTNSGQGFVNDPKISGRSITRGQIKLKFSDVKENEVTVCRIVEVKQNANTLKFCSKDNTLSIDRCNNQEPQSVSERCADINNYCCQVLNVSKPILNNVIFCHQENSTWPLDEGKKLKEKFDEIFDADKYNKCTDLLRKCLKTKRAKIKTLNMELSYRTQIKDEVERYKRQLQDKEDKLQNLEANIVIKNAELVPVVQRIEQICDLENVLCKLQRDLATKEQAVKGIIEQQNTIRNGIQFEFEGNDDELQTKIETFENEQQKDQKNLEDLDKRRMDIEKKNKDITSEVQGIQVKLGQLNEEKRQNLNKCKERQELIEKGKIQMKIQTSVDYNKDENIKIVLNELESVLKISQGEFNDIQQNQNAEERNLQMKIDEIREKYVSTKQNIESKMNDVKTCEKKVTDITNEFGTMNVADEMLKDVVDKIKKLEDSLFRMTKEFEVNGNEKKIEESQKEMRQIEQKLDDLNKEYRILNQNHGTEEKLEREKHSIIQKQLQINELKSKHFHNLKELFNDDIPTTDFKNAVQEILDTNNIIETDLNEKITKKQKDVITLEAQKSNCLEKVKNFESELKDNENKIFEYCIGKSFNTVIENVYQKKEKLQKDKGQYSSAKIMYEKFIDEFEKEKPSCPVCQTCFNGKNGAVKQIITNMRMKIETFPQKLVKVIEELSKEEELYNKLQQLKAVNDNIEMLSNAKIPLLKEELGTISKKLQDNSKELSDLMVQIKGPQKKVMICRNIVSDAALLDQCQIDIKSSERTIELLKGGIIKVNSNRSKQETEAEIDSLTADYSDIKKKVDTLRSKVDKHKARYQQTTQEKSVELKKQIDLQNATKSRSVLEKQKVELNEKINVLKNEISELKSKQTSLDIELNNAIEDRHCVIEINKKCIDDKRNEIAKNKKIVDDIKRVQYEIDKYLEKNVEALCISITEELNKLRTKEESFDLFKNEIINTISKVKEKLAKQESNFRNLKDNVLLREKQKLQKILNVEIVELKKQIGNHNYNSVYKEKQELQQKSDKISREVNLITGQKEELVSSIKEMKADLEKPEKKNAYNEYRKKYYELKIIEYSAKDITKYVTALEYSILQFHKERMVEINKSIRELWRSIYRGNDIDYIEIKTEEGISTASKRSYNYKVVQVKKGIELDMRGRCSAGQRVLACLIIRIALAETFSSNCGILALDEPTTNLDRENIVSLSDALSRIVNQRQSEKNFQLLVITHDEDFLDTLTRVENVSYYYKVSRNDDGFSKITKQNI